MNTNNVKTIEKRVDDSKKEIILNSMDIFLNRCMGEDNYPLNDFVYIEDITKTFKIYINRTVLAHDMNAQMIRHSDLAWTERYTRDLSVKIASELMDAFESILKKSVAANKDCPLTHEDFRHFEEVMENLGFDPKQGHKFISNEFTRLTLDEFADIKKKVIDYYSTEIFIASVDDFRNTLGTVGLYEMLYNKSLQQYKQVTQEEFIEEIKNEREVAEEFINNDLKTAARDFYKDGKLYVEYNGEVYEVVNKHTRVSPKEETIATVSDASTDMQTNEIASATEEHDEMPDNTNDGKLYFYDNEYSKMKELNIHNFQKFNMLRPVYDRMLYVKNHDGSFSTTEKTL